MFKKLICSVFLLAQISESLTVVSGKLNDMSRVINEHEFDSNGQLTIVDDGELLQKFNGNHTIKTVYSNYGFIPYSFKERWYMVYYNQTNRQGCNPEGLMWNKTFTREVNRNYDIAVMV